MLSRGPQAVAAVADAAQRLGVRVPLPVCVSEGACWASLIPRATPDPVEPMVVVDEDAKMG